MASGHVRRTNRSNTWPHRPALQNVQITLANGEPSTHGRKPNDGFADQDVESCRSLSFHRTDMCSVALTLSDLAGKPRLVVTERIR